MLENDNSSNNTAPIRPQNWSAAAKLEPEYRIHLTRIHSILKAEKLDAHRGKAKLKTERKNPELYIAKNPNEIWSWDITYLASDVKGLFYYLYLIMDIFSRKIVGYEVYETQSAEYASNVAELAHKTENINGKVVLHSDNGSPMKGATNGLYEFIAILMWFI